MRLRAWPKFMLAVVPGLLLTATIAQADTYSSRRGGGPPAPPPDVVESADADDGVDQIVISPSDETPFYYGQGGVAAPGCQLPSTVYQPNYGCAAGCDNSCDMAMDCCTCCCPNWTIRGGAVFLRKQNNGADIALGVGAGPTVVTTGDLGFDYTAGAAVDAIRHNFLDSDWDLEVNYFGVDGFNATTTLPGITTVGTLPPIIVGVPATGTFTYISQLYSTEVNFRRQWTPCVTFLAGFRWIELGEELRTDIGGIAAVSDDVNNHLYGFQLGLDATLLQRGRFSIEGYAKGGIYGTTADVTTTTVGVGGALPIVTASDNDAAFVGDLALTGVYQLTSGWSLRGGYQVLFIDGVALAPNQLNNTNIVTGVATVDTDATAFYHGFTAAAEYRW